MGTFFKFGLILSAFLAAEAGAPIYASAQNRDLAQSRSCPEDLTRPHG